VSTQTSYLGPTDESDPPPSATHRRTDHDAEPCSGSEWADYSNDDRYMDHTVSFLTPTRGTVVFLGGATLVGPSEERWDLVMAVRQSSVQSFLELASDQDYVVGTCHRTAALAGSRPHQLVERALD
jgi:hypothetical protein